MTDACLKPKMRLVAWQGGIEVEEGADQGLPLFFFFGGGGGDGEGGKWL